MLSDLCAALQVGEKKKKFGGGWWKCEETERNLFKTKEPFTIILPSEFSYIL